MLSDLLGESVRFIREDSKYSGKVGRIRAVYANRYGCHFVVELATGEFLSWTAVNWQIVDPLQENRNVERTDQANSTAVQPAPGHST